MYISSHVHYETFQVLTKPILPLPTPAIPPVLGALSNTTTGFGLPGGAGNLLSSAI